MALDETSTPEALTRLCYVSTSRIEDDADTFQTHMRDILQACSRNNYELGLSGILIHDGGQFVQLLEGPGTALERLMGTIRTDDRHTDLADLIAGEDCPERLFPSWSMAFVNAAGPEDAPAEPHWRDLARDPLLERLNTASRLKSVLSVPSMPGRG